MHLLRKGDKRPYQHTGKREGWLSYINRASREVWNKFNAKIRRMPTGAYLHAKEMEKAKPPHDQARRAR